MEKNTPFTCCRYCRTPLSSAELWCRLCGHAQRPLLPVASPSPTRVLPLRETWCWYDCGLREDSYRGVFWAGAHLGGLSATILTTILIVLFAPFTVGLSLPIGIILGIFIGVIPALLFGGLLGLLLYAVVRPYCSRLKYSRAVLLGMGVALLQCLFVLTLTLAIRNPWSSGDPTDGLFAAWLFTPPAILLAGGWFGGEIHRAANASRFLPK